MKIVRKANDRGRTRLSWLESRHSFSFGEYFDPRQMGFRSLRVINEDRVQPGQGFGTHPHRDMEILTYVMEGCLAHRDSMGHERVVQAGELQAMSAGRGITHSEFNPSATDPVHFLQIWIMPSARGLKPGYAEWKPNGSTAGPLVLLASSEGAEESVRINQDARVYLGRLETGQRLERSLAPTRGFWLHLMEGTLLEGDRALGAGDALGWEREPRLEVAASGPARFLLFDLN